MLRAAAKRAPMGGSPMLKLPEGSWWDWDVLHFDGSQLTLAAGHDLTYHHGLEVVFADVDYLACPTRFHDPQFREPTPDEQALLHRHIGEEPALIVAFDVEPPVGSDPLPCLIAARSVEVKPGLVYRYWHDNLRPGERRAPHIRPPAAP
jgi:hypothetical protein